MPFPLFGVLSGGKPSFQLFSDSEQYLPSVSRLTQSLTINGTTVSPSFLYYGGDASTSGWTAQVGDDLAYNAGGGAITENVGSPLLGSVDDSVKFDGNAYFQAAGASSGDIGTNDLVFELLLKLRPYSGDYSFDKRDGSNNGYQFLQYYIGDQPQLRFVLGASSLLTSAVGRNFQDNAWYHVMVFVNRDENSTNGAKMYWNGLLEQSGNPSGESGDLDSTAKLTVGAKVDGSAGFEDGSIAYAALWQSSSWHQAGADGPTEWADIALERFLKLTGFYPQRSVGTATPNTWGTASGRGSTAYLDKLESGVRYLYKVGDDWLRFVDRQDSVATRVKGFLIEEAKTNKCLQSEDMDTTWTKIDAGDAIGGSVAVPNKETSVTAGIIADNTDGQHGVTQDVTLTAATYTFSIFAKKGASDWLYAIDTTSGDGSYFDLDSGALGSAQGGATAFMEDWGNGWYRCGFQTAGTVAAHTFELSPAGGDGDNTVVGNGSDVDVYCWGAQVEDHEYPTSYFPTETGTDARSADTLQYKADDGNIGGVGSDQKGTFVCDIYKQYLSNNIYMFALSDGGAAADYMALRENSGTGVLGYLSAATGGSAGSVTGSTDLSDDTVHGVRLTWKADEVTIYVDGSSEGTPDTDVGIPDNLDELDIGTFYSGAGQFGNILSNLKVYSFITLK